MLELTWNGAEPITLEDAHSAASSKTGDSHLKGGLGRQDDRYVRWERFGIPSCLPLDVKRPKLNFSTMAFASDKEALDALRGKHAELTAEIRKVIVGQEEVVEQVLVSVFSGGHCLLVGVPGLAKTLLVNTIAQALGLSFNRIQFTPDLMPSDIIGSEILDDQRRFQFNKGPLFANIILADEINRTPPKTQSALLEAMQERS